MKTKIFFERDILPHPWGKMPPMVYEWGEFKLNLN